MQQVQTLPFQRWIGQVVYRDVRPTHGPHAYKTVAIRRGVIVDIYKLKNYPLLHETHFDVDVTWHSLEVTRIPIPEGFKMHDGDRHNYHTRVSAPFDYGLITVFEMELLLKGALLGRDGPTFDETQPEELKAVLPFYQKIVDTPSLSYVLTER